MSIIDKTVLFGLEALGGGVFLCSPIILIWLIVLGNGCIKYMANECFEEEEIAIEQPYFDRYPKGLKRYNDTMNSFKQYELKRSALLNIVNNSKKDYIEKKALSEQLMKNRSICKRCNFIAIQNPNIDLPDSLSYWPIKEQIRYKHTICICDHENHSNFEWAERDALQAIEDYGKNQYNIIMCLFPLSEEGDTENTLLLFHLNELFKAEKLLREIKPNCWGSLSYLNIDETKRYLEHSGIPKEAYEGMISYYR